MKEFLFSSCFLILFLILIRPFIRGRIPFRLQYALWGVVLIRLLIPFPLFHYTNSFTNMVSEISHIANVTTNYTDRNQKSSPLIDNNHSIDQTLNQTNLLPQGNNIHKPNSTNTSTSSIEPTNELAPFPLSLSQIIIGIWLAGIILATFCMLLSHFIFYQKLKRSRSPLLIKKDSTPVYVTAILSSPCLLGTLHPSIYLTKEVVNNPSKLEFTLAHERTHLAHYDHIWSILRIICLLIHWYNPLVWCAASLSKRDGELACDEGTLKRMGEQKRYEYGKVLIDLAKSSPSPKHYNIFTSSMNSGKQSLKERVRYIAKRPNSIPTLMVFTIFLVLAATGCSFTGVNNNLNQPSSATPSKAPTELYPTNALSVTPNITPTNIPANGRGETPIMNAITGKSLNDLSSFQTMKDCFMDKQFKSITLDKNKDDSPDYYSNTLSIDLNNDKRADNIQIVSQSDEQFTSFISVNNQKISFTNFSPIDKEVYLIDLDKKDSYTEIACYDSGPSGDECYHLFQYDGYTLYQIGTIDAYALSDQNGKLISSFHLTKYFTPQFCSAWYEIKDHSLVLYNNDTSSYLGRNYQYVGGQAYFVASSYDQISDFTKVNSTLNDVKPQKIKLLDIMYNPYQIDFSDRSLIYYQYRVLNYFYVEAESGEKGVLYFFNGD